MIAMRFVDTNVLIYAVGTAPDEANKTHIALDILKRRDLVLSVQVLQEFYVQATRPTRQGALTHAEATQFIASLERYPVQAITLEVLHAALAIRDRFRLSYWDSAILAAAQATGCDQVYSEDLSSEQNYDGVCVLNPFP